MKNLLAVAALAGLVALPGCGGSSNSPAAPPPAPTPTPTPASLTGFYAGPMIFNVAGQAELRPQGTVAIVQTGSNILYGTGLHLTGGGLNTTLDIGSGTLVGDVANGTNSYQSSGCGTVHVTTVGRFAGRLVNLTAELTPTVFNNTCGVFRVVGELSR